MTERISRMSRKRELRKIESLAILLREEGVDALCSRMTMKIAKNLSRELAKKHGDHVDLIIGEASEKVGAILHALLKSETNLSAGEANRIFLLTLSGLQRCLQPVDTRHWDEMIAERYVSYFRSERLVSAIYREIIQ